jgi:hypothetical protein
MTDDDRRLMDVQWKASVDQKLADGGEKFDQLHAGQTTMLGRMDEQDIALKGIGDTLDTHIVTTKKLADSVAPLIKAVDTMESGVRVLGAIGTGVSWTGRMLRRTVVWLAPFGALVATLYHFFHPTK